ncbi:MAG: 50S ribosomal protein L32 [Desulfovibrionaceae bacterium]
MAVQQNKKSRSRKGMRRSHDRVCVPNIVSCTGCGAPTLSHVVCARCGAYRGRRYFAINPQA